MKYLVALIGIIIVGAVATTLIIGISQVGVNKGYEPEQPIAFSHKLHAGDNEISCQYCHHASNQGRHAGIPAVSTCMNCHSHIKKDSPEIAKIKKALEDKQPINWVKVNRLADFVYFSHERHVRIGELKCQTCHGPVETMEKVRQEKHLSMGWCINCHREKDVLVHGTQEVVKVADPKIGGLDCAKCHM